MLAQVAFSPIIRIEEHVEAFREALHAMGFPWAQAGLVQEFTFVAESGDTPKPPVVSSRPRWDYWTADRRTSVTLTERTLAVQTTDYSSREPFLRLFYDVVAAGAMAFAGAQLVVERLGLRFTDVVRVAPGERFSEYVDPGLLGFPWRAAPGLQARGAGLHTETLGQTAVGLFLIRSSVLPPGQIAPADLLSPGLLFPPVREEVAAQPALALDFDHFIPLTQPPFNGHPPMALDATAVLALVRHLHAGHREAFEAASTPHAKQRWGPEVA
ncbi:MAG: TIGR04255 family protein [Gemmatimonadaceae bacterium]|nr:TIGR04255 family protein [Gemmatimonadaceae bacterium]